MLSKFVLKTISLMIVSLFSTSLFASDNGCMYQSSSNQRANTQQVNIVFEKNIDPQYMANFNPSMFNVSQQCTDFMVNIKHNLPDNYEYKVISPREIEFRTKIFNDIAETDSVQIGVSDEFGPDIIPKNSDLKPHQDHGKKSRPAFDNKRQPDDSIGKIAGGVGFIVLTFQLTSNENFKQTWNGFYSSGSDEIFDKSLDKLRKGMELTLTKAIQEIEEQNRKTLKEYENLHTEYNLLNLKIDKISDRVKNGFSGMTNSIDKSIGHINKIQTITSKISANNYNPSNTATKQSAALARGLLTSNSEKIISEKLRQSISNSQPAEAAMDISFQQGRIAKAQSSEAREQLVNIMRSVTDSRGIIKSWALLSDFPEEVSLSTNEFSPVGRAVRQNLNQALGESLKGQNSEHIAYNYATQLALDADQQYAMGNKVQGDRYLNRSRALIEFNSEDSDLYPYHSLVSSARAKEIFGISKRGKDFFDFETVKLTNQLAEISMSKLSDSQYMLMQMSVEKLQSLSNYESLTSYNRELDNAYAVLDMAKGFTKGLYIAAGSLVSGTIEMVSHPIDTASALGSALYNYEKTYEIIVDSINKVIEEYPSYTPTQKAELAGKITFEVASSFVGVGTIVKAGTKVNQLAKVSGFGKAIDRLVPDVAKVLSRTGKIAPDEFLDVVDLTRHMDEGRFAADRAVIARRVFDAAKDIGWYADDIKRFAKGSTDVTRHGSLSKGRMHDIPMGTGSLADTFRSSSYFSYKSTETISLYRVQGKAYANGDRMGRFWTRDKPTGPIQSIIDSALDPTWGNTGTHWVRIDVPAGTSMHEGMAAAQRGLVGGGNQIILEQVPSTWVKGQGSF